MLNKQGKELLSQYNLTPNGNLKLVDWSSIFPRLFHPMLQIFISQPFTDNSVELDRIFEMNPMGTLQGLK